MPIQTEQAETTTFGGVSTVKPFQQAFELTFAQGVNQVTGTIGVPPGKQFVIETVTADIGVGDQEQPFLFVTTVAKGVEAQHTIALEELPRQPNVFCATYPIRLYADPGSTVTVMVTRFGGGTFPAIPKPELVTLSGFITP